MSAAGRDRLLVSVVCVLCYLNFGGGTFHYDDFHSLVDNHHIRSLTNIPTFFADPTAFSSDPQKKMYRPLLLVTYALQYAVHRYEPLGFLLINLLVHVVASLLVCAVAKALLVDRRASLVAALIFAAHPLAGEPVNYISSRSESLAACFYLGAALFHWRERNMLSVVCFALGLLVKSVVLTAPLLLWLGDRWIKNKKQSWRVWIPFATVGAAYLALITYNRFLTGSLTAPVREWSTQLMTQLKVPAYYAHLVAMPLRLNIEHQFFEAHAADPAVWVGAGFVASLMIIAWMGRRHMPGAAVWWGAVVLLPTTLMPLNVLVNERRLYLVVAGVALALGYMLRRIDRRWLWVWLLCAGGLVWQRNYLWASELRIWGDAVAKAPQMYRAQVSWGKSLQMEGRWSAAMAAYERAIALNARRADAHNNAATLWHLQGKVDRAIEGYQRALHCEPRLEEVHQNLGDAYAQKGNYEQSIASYRRAIAIEEGKGEIWSNYGLSLYSSGDLMAAEEAFLRAIELMPDQAEPYNNLGNVYVDRGEYDRAEAHYGRALAKATDERDQVLANLGDLHRLQGRYAAGRQRFAEALAWREDKAEWHFRLARLERAAGQNEAATAALNLALMNDPDHVGARIQRGEISAEVGDWPQASGDFRIAIAADSSVTRAWFGLAGALEKMNEDLSAAEAYHQFVARWTKDDGRKRHALDRLRALKARVQ